MPEKTTQEEGAELYELMVPLAQGIGAAQLIVLAFKPDGTSRTGYIGGDEKSSNDVQAAIVNILLSAILGLMDSGPDVWALVQLITPALRDMIEVAQEDREAAIKGVTNVLAAVLEESFGDGKDEAGHV